jgi:5-methylcytosine-specific restriction endonuclease McrA
MVMITATIYFSNNVMIRHQVTLARAVTLMNHTHAVIPVDAGLLELHSPSQVMLVPDQIVFNINRALVPRTPQPTKRSIYEREKGQCAYCGRWIPFPAATLDHVLPQSLDGENTWDNLVNCCLRCNQRKGGRTPEQARMKLLFRPFTPKVRLRPE